ncbi:hypothetical protein [Bosea sp. 2RAB26]|uniref:hypothetical protein n=1 Tax=Bosea sp. 2RAB26 TaxID=3237476 RepID=UPI003F91A9DB
MRVYLALGLILLAYTALGEVASRGAVVPLKLRAGEAVEVSVWRLNPGRMRMFARFQGRNRPEFDAKLEFDIRPAWQSPVRAKVGGVASWSIGETVLHLTAAGRGVALAERQGVLVAPWVVFERGANRLTIEVADVDPSLVGETITLFIEPALGLKFTEQETRWLWASFAWPIYGLLYLFGAALLFGL